jgi:hypothetical protein
LGIVDVKAHGFIVDTELRLFLFLVLILILFLCLLLLVNFWEEDPIILESGFFEVFSNLFEYLGTIFGLFFESIQVEPHRRDFLNDKKDKQYEEWPVNTGLSFLQRDDVLLLIETTKEE